MLAAVTGAEPAAAPPANLGGASSSGTAAAAGRQYPWASRLSSAEVAALNERASQLFESGACGLSMVRGACVRLHAGMSCGLAWTLVVISILLGIPLASIKGCLLLIMALPAPHSHTRSYTLHDQPGPSFSLPHTILASHKWPTPCLTHFRSAHQP